jgi:hypothetical protein
MTISIHQRTRDHAIITPNARGGWSLLLPSAGIPLGNYGTAADASRVAVLNGYEPEIHEGRPVVDATNPKIWKPEAAPCQR